MTPQQLMRRRAKVQQPHVMAELPPGTVAGQPVGAEHALDELSDGYRQLAQLIDPGGCQTGRRRTSKTRSPSGVTRSSHQHG